MNFLLGSEINDPSLQGVRITTVTLSPDGASARLYFTMETSDTSTDPDRALRRATGFFRRALCDALSLKRTPELRFAVDPAPPIHFSNEEAVK